jgi:hypothetical protein
MISAATVEKTKTLARLYANRGACRWCGGAAPSEPRRFGPNDAAEWGPPRTTAKGNAMYPGFAG